MANKNPKTENLKPFNELTEKEQRKITSKGGKKSGQVRAERKKFNELFNNYLDKKITNEQIKQQMLEFGFKDKECTNKNAIVFAQYKEALKGSTQAFIAVRDTMGEKPQEKVNISGQVNNPFEGMSTEELRKILNE